MPITYPSPSLLQPMLLVLLLSDDDDRVGLRHGRHRGHGHKSSRELFTASFSVLRRKAFLKLVLNWNLMQNWIDFVISISFSSVRIVLMSPFSLLMGTSTTNVPLQYHNESKNGNSVLIFYAFEHSFYKPLFSKILITSSTLCSWVPVI